MRKKVCLLWSIVLLTIFAVIIDVPSEFNIRFGWGRFKINQKVSRPNINISFGNNKFVRDLEIKKGIDLAGGSHLVFEADVSKLNEQDRDSAVESAKNNIERRVNLFGVNEANVRASKVNENYRLIVEIPGIKDINQAIDLIGKTAQLGFWELKEIKASKEASASASFFPTDLTGADLVKADVQFDPNTGEPSIGIRFSSGGTGKFAEITKRNIGKPLAIYLDMIPVTAPVVKEEIISGEAVISGTFTLEEAKKLAIQLNAGALPVPINLIEQKNVGASLGEESVQKSIRAGLIGLGMVAIFMVANYGMLGVLANLGLIIYALLTLALYKLIPITLTLPGIAGFLLSIGMAVDSNILVFERMKEEVRSGKSTISAMELGFGRAWDSIRDANVCTLIIGFVLINPFNWRFLNDSGMVRGFALTLVIGVLLGLFTGIVVTRTILRTFVSDRQKAISEK